SRLPTRARRTSRMATWTEAAAPSRTEQPRRLSPPRANRRCVRSFVLLHLTACALLLGAGCASAPGGSVTIRQLHMFGVPVAVNLDQVPGPDGFAFRVFASDGQTARGAAITRGRLEVQLFDGTPSESERAQAQPLRVWTYDAAQLRGHAAHSSIGWGYEFAPQWGDARPTHNRFTVVVRYVSPSGNVVAASPSVISMTAR